MSACKISQLSRKSLLIAGFTCTRILGRVLDEAFRADLIVENELLAGLKAAERFTPVHAKQVITYRRSMDLPLGFLVNFGATAFKGGVKRIANDYYAS